MLNPGDTGTVLLWRLMGALWYMEMLMGLLGEVADRELEVGEWR